MWCPSLFTPCDCPEFEFRQVVEAMKDEERAAMVIAMSVGLRKEAATAVDPRLWERTMDIIRNHSGHAARCVMSQGCQNIRPGWQAGGCLTGALLHTW